MKEIVLAFALVTPVVEVVPVVLVELLVLEEVSSLDVSELLEELDSSSSVPPLKKFPILEKALVIAPSTPRLLILSEVEEELSSVDVVSFRLLVPVDVLAVAVKLEVSPFATSVIASFTLVPLNISKYCCAYFFRFSR